ncbi:MAG: TrkA family potassium uptake protein [candidate division WOR-3 bacterium]
MKQYVVIGLGNFGFNVATALARMGHEVLAIDRNGRKVEDIKELVTQAVIADATDKDALAALIPETVDAVIVAMGDNLEASILITLALKELKVKQIIVKALSPEHARALELIGATEVVQPERDVALALADRLSTSNILNIIAFSPEYTVADVATPETFWGKTLAQLGLRTNYGILVIAVKDLLQNKTHIAPGPDFKIGPDTVLTVLGRYEDISKLTR